MKKTFGVAVGAAVDLGTADTGQVDRLRREHEELKTRLSARNARAYLSPEEELEKKLLQKLKLAKKDQLAALMVRYSGSS